MLRLRRPVLYLRAGVVLPECSPDPLWAHRCPLAVLDRETIVGVTEEDVERIDAAATLRARVAELESK